MPADRNKGVLGREENTSENTVLFSWQQTWLVTAMSKWLRLGGPWKNAKQLEEGILCVDLVQSYCWPAPLH